MNKERLLLLAEFLENEVSESRWNYRRIVGGNWGGAPDLSCGTTACALGWATTIPELRDAGLRLFLFTATPVKDLAYPCLYLDGTKIFEAACKVFGITMNEANFLFNPSDQDSETPSPDASAAEVAQHIRAFVAVGGTWSISYG